MYLHHLHTGRSLPDEVCRKLEMNKQLIEIILLKEELIRDVEADVQRIERMRKMDVSPLVGNDADYYDISRDIDNALGDVVSRCAAYLLLPSPFAHRISTNHAKGWEEESIYLALPHNWPPHNIEPIRNNIHEYIVKSVELELLTMSMPDDRYLPVLADKKEKLYSTINALLNERLGVTPLVQTPFG